MLTTKGGTMILTKTPLRISLAGGGTDLPAYYENSGWGAVCSFAIQRYVYIFAKDLPHEFPYNYKLAYSQTELKITESSIQHPILRSIVATHLLRRLDFAAMADIPAGTGMGSSSAFTVGTLHAAKLLKGILPTKAELAQEACEVEIKKLGGSLGKQDQYACAYGGINYIKFHKEKSVMVQPIVLDSQREDLFMAHLRLYFLGTNTRDAETILREQKKCGKVLDEIRSQAKVCVDILTHGIVEELGRLLHTAWGLKKRLSARISNAHVDALYDAALKQGVWGGKLLGAGGSGYLLLCCPPDLNLDLGLKRVPLGIDYNGSLGYTL